MFSNRLFFQAQRFLLGAGLALALALALLIAHCYLVGGRAPAMLLGVFLCMTCQVFLPLAAFALWGLLTRRRPARRSWSAGPREGRLRSRLGAFLDAPAPHLTPGE